MFDDFDTQIQSDELTSQYLSEKELQEIFAEANNPTWKIKKNML